ncbi:glycosyltransferase family 2 protein [Halorientalis sp.]|uniref:glycosyltransferase family 2 protein n=1 Tax=Halorientalis sp. TaxID=1931229 RepID=UPI00261F925B|nr:glycosyltransferase family 2 protein [Halorientalis sp.]
MSEPEAGTRFEADAHRTDQPLIGLSVDVSTNPDAVAGAILRATEQGNAVSVEHSCDRPHEALAFADRLGAHMVHTNNEGEGPSDAALKHARDIGYPGIIWVAQPTCDETGPTSRTQIGIDFQESVHELQRSEAYVVDAVRRTDLPPDQRVIVGIPTYNEEVGIGSVVLRADDYADEVIVVDDGSSDETVSVARNAGATVVEHETNDGKGAAVQTLFQYVAPTEFDTLVLLDGDGQHVPEDIPDVTEPVIDGGADLVVGSRYLENGDDETPRLRRFGQRVLDALTIGSSRVNVTDSQSGFRALSSTAVEELSLSATSFGVESEMISEAAEKGFDIEEQPIEVRYEGIDGQTQNPLRHGLTVVVFLLQLVRDRHPMLFFGLPGLALTAVGAWYGVDAITVYQRTGQFYPAKVLVSGFATILGTLGIFIGLVLNRISNIVAGLKPGGS